MDSFACPLCCHQKFDSIIALREHLLYFIYRPLICVLCSVSIGGIYELTRHLETHLNNNKRTSFYDIKADENFNENSSAESKCNNDSSWDKLNPSEDTRLKESLQLSAFHKAAKVSSINHYDNQENVSPIKPPLLLQNRLSTQILVQNRDSLACKPYPSTSSLSNSTENIETWQDSSITQPNIYLSSESFSSAWENSCSSIDDYSKNESRETLSTHCQMPECSPSYSETGEEVRAFVCKVCGLKVVGKDFYFKHLQNCNLVNYDATTPGQQREGTANVVGNSEELMRGDKTNFLLESSPPRASIETFVVFNEGEVEQSTGRFLALDEYVTDPFQNDYNIIEFKGKSHLHENLSSTKTNDFNIEFKGESHFRENLSSTETNDFNIEFKGESHFRENLSSTETNDFNIEFKGESHFRENMSSAQTNPLPNPTLSSTLDVAENRTTDYSYLKPPSPVDTRILSCPKSPSQPYIHKKFDHDQERKPETENSKNDVQCYIQNFQSLLVNKLNQAFETNPIKSPGEEPRREEEQELDDPLPASDHESNISGEPKPNLSDEPKPNLSDEPKPESKYTCKYCLKSYICKQSRDTHERSHTCRNTSKCKYCQKVFAKPFLLNRHIQEIHSMNTFYCNLCGRHFRSLRSLANHKGIHEKKRFRCSQCPYACHTSSGLRTHVFEAHSHKPAAISCPHCSETFKRKYGLQRHIERKHKTGNLSCRYCDKDFPCKEDLNHHLSTHLDNKSLTCDICNKIFTTLGSLKRHSAKHSKRTDVFKCEKCSSVFTRKDSLLSHSKLHVQTRRFLCKCGKGFNKRSQLKYHEVKHTKLPQFKCESCHKSYKFKVSLRNHSCKMNAKTP